MVSKAEMKVPRVVLDTNVVISALLSKSGRVNWLVPLWTIGRVMPLVSKATVCELIRVLAYPKFRLDVAERQAVLAAYLPYAETVGAGVRFGGARCRDQYEEMFLSLASRGDADYLVSGDADLLSVKDFAACPIITLEQFRQKMACL